MTLFLVIYWIFSGIALFSIPTQYQNNHTYSIPMFFICLALGGIIFPIKLMSKLMQ